MGFAAPAVPYLVAAGGSILANKIGGKKSTQQVNPNSPQMQGLQNDFATFLQGIIGDPAKASGKMGLTSDLQRLSTGGIQQFLNQPSPEVATFEKLSPGLMDIFGQSGQGLTDAMFPLFQRGLQEGLGSLSNSGMGRFSTTFEKQGVDLTSRAMQDFNLLQQQAFQQNVGNRLGAASLLGTLSGQAGQNPFQRLFQAGQLGTQQTAQNPILQLLLGGMNFAKNSPMDTVVGDSALDAGLKGMSAYSMLRGDRSPGFETWADAWNSGGRR